MFVFKRCCLCADLQWEEDDGKTDHCSDANCHDDSVGVIEAGDHAHHVWKAQSENRLEKHTQDKQIVIAYDASLHAEMLRDRLFIIHGTEKSSHQCHQVPGVLAAEVSAAAEDDQSDEEDCIGDVVRPRIDSDKLLGIFAKGEDGHERESDQQLHSQHQEDLTKKGRFVNEKSWTFT